MKLTWHPFAEKFPLLVGDEKKALVASIKATGGNQQQPIHYRVVNGKRQGLDGRNRLIACEELGLTPTLEEVEVSDDDVVEYVIRRNITRRHMNRELRHSLVADMKANGESNRKIAAAVGVSESTIREDVKAIPGSGARNRAPDSKATTLPKVTGKDGKSYPAKPPKKPKSSVPQVRTDAFGTPVPDHLRDVFFDSWIGDGVSEIDLIDRRISAIRRAVVGKSGPYGAWLEHKEILDKLDDLTAIASDVKRMLEKDKPHAVCSCGGEGCKQCRQSGWLPKWRHSEIKTGVCSE